MQGRIEELAAVPTLSAKEIHEAITAEFGVDIPGTDKKTPPCSLRTVQTIVREKRPPGDTTPWSLSNAEPSEAALVMPVLRTLIERTDAKRIHITLGEAAAVVKVRRVNPDLPLWHAWLFAREYLAREHHGQPAEELDAIVATYDPHDPGPMNTLRKVLVTTTGSTVVRDFLDGLSPEFNPVGIQRVSIREEDEDGEA